MIEERINKQLVVVVTVLIIALSFWSGTKYAQWRLIKQPLTIVDESIPKEVDKEDNAPQKEEKVISEPQKIYVHIAGAVKNPGVYQLFAGDRLEAALQLAGPTEKANVDKYLNRAALLVDGQKVYVPEQGEEGEEVVIAPIANAAHGNSSTQGIVGKININSAVLKELDTLDGIGPSKGQAIIDYRNNNGGFTSIEEIKNVKGIGEATFEKIRNKITVN